MQSRRLQAWTHGRGAALMQVRHNQAGTAPLSCSALSRTSSPGHLLQQATHHPAQLSIKHKKANASERTLPDRQDTGRTQNTARQAGLTHHLSWPRS